MPRGGDVTDAIRLATALATRYRIEHELGQGGMATVYLAQDLRHDRQVAIKVLRPELAAVLGADRFVQEISVRKDSVRGSSANVSATARCQQSAPRKGPASMTRWISGSSDRAGRIQASR